MTGTWMRLLVLVAVGAFAFAVGTTYERYRGTDLSRAPALGRVDASAAEPLAAVVPPDPGTAPSSEVERVGSARGPRPGIPALDDDLQLYPSIIKGTRTPFDLWRYYGRGVSSFADA